MTSDFRGAYSNFPVRYQTHRREKNALINATFTWIWLDFKNIYFEFEQSVVVVACQYTNRLQRFPKPHVVAQDAVQLVLIQESQPVYTTLEKEELIWY